MSSPYEKCPEYENENYMLRMIRKEDKADLLKVYSDEKSVPFFNSDNCGLLRLDLRSDYEQEERIFEILSLIVPSVFKLFQCQIIATKIPPFASDRKLAILRLGFVASEEKLIGHDKEFYTDYYVLQE